ncbi:hypothetical protein F4808DRAFT_334891 [Astrocystis sublimbata]|nr:hypothetical protein F4808DRAFT_334891 [Astrocystis sublimbata]
MTLSQHFVSSGQELRLLKSNVELIAPTDEKPYYSISIENEAKTCKIEIAAGKSFPPVPIEIHPLHPDWESHKPKASEWVTISHADRCECTWWSSNPKSFFDLWQEIHIELRHNSASDQASYAFYPKFSYLDIGEDLAHASLMASIAVGKEVPSCYEDLVKTWGTNRAKRALGVTVHEYANAPTPDDSDVTDDELPDLIDGEGEGDDDDDEDDEDFDPGNLYWP